MPKFVLLDKNGAIRVVMGHTRYGDDPRIEEILEYETYAAALKMAEEHGNLDVAEVRVITRVRTTTHRHQNIDPCLEE
jgi:molybdopterin synthase catalytic subunit